MKEAIITVMGSICLLISACTEPHVDSKCSRALSSFVESLEKMPAESPRDEVKLQAMKEKVDQIMTENRRNGIDDCETWRLVMAAAAKQ